MANIIEVKDLRKSYGKGENKVDALKGISFNIKKGETFGFLGPNGAGKSTTINILCGLLSKDSGHVRIFGNDIRKDFEQIKQRMNVANAYTHLNNSLTVEQNLRVYGKLYGVKDVEKKIAEVADTFSIVYLKKKEAGKLSSGENTRVCLAKCFISDPELMLLDEPTVGLDPDFADKTKEYIREYQKTNNTTILFTSHIMSEVEYLCKRILFLNNGEVLRLGSSRQLKNLVKTQIVELTLGMKKDKALALIKRSGGRLINYDSEKIVFEINQLNYSLHDIMHPLIKAGFKIKDMHIKKPTLEQVFIKISRGEL
ncbi:MAG: ABC transporter ATP-binding protein [Nanoarchaeota archaeon]|nr:ABC transporter ATP-binding protein [Nanoarchaeota archaeon]